MNRELKSDWKGVILRMICMDVPINSEQTLCIRRLLHLPMSIVAFRLCWMRGVESYINNI